MELGTRSAALGLFLLANRSDRSTRTIAPLTRIQHLTFASSTLDLHPATGCTDPIALTQLSNQTTATNRTRRRKSAHCSSAPRRPTNTTTRIQAPRAVWGPLQASAKQNSSTGRHRARAATPVGRGLPRGRPRRRVNCTQPEGAQPKELETTATARQSRSTRFQPRPSLAHEAPGPNHQNTHKPTHLARATRAQRVLRESTLDKWKQTGTGTLEH